MRYALGLLAALFLTSCAPPAAPAPSSGSAGATAGGQPSPSRAPDPVDLAWLAQQRERWAAQRPHAYRFSYTRRCFCPRASQGPFAVTVRGDEVTEVVYEGDLEIAWSEEALAAAGRTVDDLIDVVAEAFASGAFAVRVDYAETGHPTVLFIDRDGRAFDDEVEFTIERVEPISD